MHVERISELIGLHYSHILLRRFIYGCDQEELLLKRLALLLNITLCTMDMSIIIRRPNGCPVRTLSSR